MDETDSTATDGTRCAGSERRGNVQNRYTRNRPNESRDGVHGESGVDRAIIRLSGMRTWARDWTWEGEGNWGKSTRESVSTRLYRALNFVR